MTGLGVADDEGDRLFAFGCEPVGGGGDGHAWWQVGCQQVERHGETGDRGQEFKLKGDQFDDFRRCGAGKMNGLGKDLDRRLRGRGNGSRGGFGSRLFFGQGRSAGGEARRHDLSADGVDQAQGLVGEGRVSKFVDKELGEAFGCSEIVVVEPENRIGIPFGDGCFAVGVEEQIQGTGTGWCKLFQNIDQRFGQAGFPPKVHIQPIKGVADFSADLGSGARLKLDLEFLLDLEVEAPDMQLIAILHTRGGPAQGPIDILRDRCYHIGVLPERPHRSGGVDDVNKLGRGQGRLKEEPTEQEAEGTNKV